MPASPRNSSTPSWHPCPISPSWISRPGQNNQGQGTAAKRAVYPPTHKKASHHTQRSMRCCRNTAPSGLALFARAAALRLPTPDLGATDCASRSRLGSSSKTKNDVSKVKIESGASGPTFTTGGYFLRRGNLKYPPSFL